LLHRTRAPAHTFHPALKRNPPALRARKRCSQYKRTKPHAPGHTPCHKPWWTAHNTRRLLFWHTCTQWRNNHPPQAWRAHPTLQHNTCTSQQRLCSRKSQGSHHRPPPSHKCTPASGRSSCFSAASTTTASFHNCSLAPMPQPWKWLTPSTREGDPHPTKSTCIPRSDAPLHGGATQCHPPPTAGALQHSQERTYTHTLQDTKPCGFVFQPAPVGFDPACDVVVCTCCCQLCLLALDAKCMGCVRGQHIQIKTVRSLCS
jgi:hypothetical protein